MPYVIDGNNLLGSWGGLQRGADRRHEVVRRVAAFCRARGARAILVFDGRPLRSEVPAQQLGPLMVRVPKEGQDADTVIRGIVDGSAHPHELIVVTSDKALYSYARTRGASVLRAHEWNAEERRLTTRGPLASDKPEREDDVEGWLKRFGVDETEG